MRNFTYLKLGIIVFLMNWGHCLMAQNAQVG